MSCLNFYVLLKLVTVNGVAGAFWDHFLAAAKQLQHQQTTRKSRVFTKSELPCLLEKQVQNDCIVVVVAATAAVVAVVDDAVVAFCLLLLL